MSSPAGYLLDEASLDPLTLAAGELACGSDPSLCAKALEQHKSTRFLGDPCAVKGQVQRAKDHSNYIFWQPGYLKSPCEGSGYLNCDASRFSPKQVRQESFLQARGQVTTSTSCQGGLRYLPQSEFDAPDATAKDRPPRDMSLYARQTKVPRSCATVTEMDLSDRLRPMPGDYVGTRATLYDGDVPASLSKRTSATLSTKKYPSWDELAKQTKAYEG